MVWELNLYQIITISRSVDFYTVTGFLLRPPQKKNVLTQILAATKVRVIFF